MSFIDAEQLTARTGLVGGHYSLERQDRLRSQFTAVLEDYWVRAKRGEQFEAKGLLVTGASRVGKSTEIRKLIRDFNDSETLLPDGKQAFIASCVLDGKCTWKDLGRRTLEALNYPLEARRTQSEIWSRVAYQMEEQGVIALHYDECQHVFPKKPNANTETILDSFKSLLKNATWPVILIMSGVDDLRHEVEREEQLARLLRPVRFNNIDPVEDLEEINTICFTYFDEAGLEFQHLAGREFSKRLAFAASHRWGLVIELVLDVCRQVSRAGRKRVELEDFVEVFVERTNFTETFNPFVWKDYQRDFDPEFLASRS
ncbi:ATP-binding protein [Roseivivax sediminis]|uniref:AAA domain-containing protein n=1 Tax=Roseivivax sediminis TaxID=936889 RepID=A0A1I2EIU2_9RHOB|nr:ATP-binding protein [Roseivivax sediminis]SFE92669.1 AAA domain-containing protein [Roseivivax sediminis]